MASTATIYLREETEMLRHKRIQTEERVRLEIQRAMEQMRN
jgi:nucleoporin GLE1